MSERVVGLFCQKTLYGVVGIFTIALTLRLWGITYGLPHEYISDESFFVRHALRFGTGDLNPHWFTYPTFFLYLLFFLYGLYFVVGFVLGIFHSLQDFATLYFLDPSAFYLIGRGAMAFIGALTVLLLYGLGRRLYGQRSGLLAAFFLASTFLHVHNSHYIAAVDIPMTFFVLLSFYFLIRFWQEMLGRFYILAGLCAGLAMANKYQAGLIVVPLVLVYLLQFPPPRRWREVVWNRDLLGGFLAVAVGFLLGCPFAVLDFPTFWSYILGLYQQSKIGWLGWKTADTSPWILLLTTWLRDGLGLPLEIASLCGVGWALYRHRREDILILSFLTVYYLVMGSTRLSRDAYWLAIVPLVVLLAARLLNELAEKLPLDRRVQTGLLGLLAVLIIFPSATRSVQFDQWLLRKDTRTLAKEWVEQNIPAKARIAMNRESGPPLSQNRDGIMEEYRLQMELSRLEEAGQTVEARSYKVVPSESAALKAEYYELLLRIPIAEPSYFVVRQSNVANKPLSYYLENAFDYLITTDSKSYLAQASQYPHVADFYRTLEQKYPRVATFYPGKDHPGPLVIIYKLR